MKKIVLASSLISTLLLADTIYVSNEKDNTISVIDSDTNKVVDTINVGQRPRGILLNKDYTKLYICASDDDTVQVLDLKSKKYFITYPQVKTLNNLL